ncbi:MAG TPA: hypothetical protein VKZ59_07770 [Acidobacteriota bacterium]|nr:hypothetical protein [Acidobacteriota bacterium]
MHDFNQELDRFSGQGDLYLGREKLFEVDYDIRILQEFAESDRITGSESLESIEGKISTTNPIDLASLVDADKIFTLRLQDGRRIDFSLVDNQGTIEPHSGLY